MILGGTSIPSYTLTNKNSNIHLNLKNQTTFHNSINSEINNNRKFTEENYKEQVTTIKINSSIAFVKNIQKGWLLDSGKWYYLRTDGFM